MTAPRTISEVQDQAKPTADAGLPGEDPDRLKTFVRLFREHGDVFQVPLPGTAGQAVVVCHPDLANQIMVRNYQSYKKGQGYGQMRLLLGNGVITLDGERWKQQRRILQPVYARSQVLERLHALAHLPEELLVRWTASADRNEVVDVTRDLTQLTFSLIMTLLCGEDYQRIRGTVMEDRFSRIAASGERDLDFVNSFAMPVRAALFDWIERRVERKERHEDLLHLLIEARDPRTGLPMAEEQILDECLTFIVAGVETTSTTLAWLWYLLASAPEVEQRLVTELDAVSGSALSGDPGAHFPYTLQTIQETMRLYPPVWVYPRIALEDDVLGGVPVARGTHVLIATYLIHRHPALWELPDQFRPARFAGGQTPAAFMPFGLGPRRCSGEDYSLTLMVMILRSIASRLALLASGDPFPGLIPEINLRPARNIRLLPRLRHKLSAGLDQEKSAGPITAGQTDGAR